MTEIKTPDYFIIEKYKSLPRTVLWAFASALVCGMAAHLYQFTNKLYNYDELVNTPGGYGIGAELGRWFLKIMADCNSRWLGGSYSLPLWNGILSIFLLALSAALVVEMFQINSHTLAVLIGAFMTVFPAVVCMFYFMFTAVFYSFGIFMSILSAYLLIRFPKKILPYIAAILLLACSIGTYQAYFANTVCLLLISFVICCAYGNEELSLKELLLTALRYLSVLLIGLVLYFLLNRMFLICWDITMMDYQGISSMGHLSLEKIIVSAGTCYQSFFAVVSENVKYLSPTNLLRKCLTVVVLMQVAGIGLFLFQKKTALSRKVFLLLAVCLFPVALFLVYIMAADSYVYAIMLYSVVFLFVFPMIWFDRFSTQKDGFVNIKKAMQWVLVLASTVIIAIYIWYANACYMSQEYTKYHDLAYYETVVTQIKSLDGYKDDMSVAFIGNGEVDDKTNNLGGLLENIVLQDGRNASNVSAYSKLHLITKYLGFAPEFCGYDETKALMERQEVKDMPCYPDDGSICIMDEIIVVKMSEYEEEE